MGEKEGGVASWFLLRPGGARKTSGNPTDTACRGSSCHWEHGLHSPRMGAQTEPQLALQITTDVAPAAAAVRTAAECTAVAVLGGTELAVVVLAGTVHAAEVLAADGCAVG